MWSSIFVSDLSLLPRSERASEVACPQMGFFFASFISRVGTSWLGMQSLSSFFFARGQQLKWSSLVGLGNSTHDGEGGHEREKDGRGRGGEGFMDIQRRGGRER